MCRPWPALALLALLVAYGALASPALEAHPPPETTTRPTMPPEPEPPRPQPEAQAVAEPRAYLLYLDYDRDPIVVDAYREEEGEIVFEKYGGRIKIPKAQVLQIVPDRPDLPPGLRPRAPIPPLLSEGFSATRRRAAASHYLSLRSGGNLKVSEVRPEGGRLRVILDEGSFTIPASEVVGILRLPADGEGWPEAWLVVKREGERASPPPPPLLPPEPARAPRRAARDEWPAPPPILAAAPPEPVPAPAAAPDGAQGRTPEDEWSAPAAPVAPTDAAEAALPQAAPEPPPAPTPAVEPTLPAGPPPVEAHPPLVQAEAPPAPAPAAALDPLPPPEPPRLTSPARTAAVPPTPVPDPPIAPLPAPAAASAAPPPFTVAALPPQAPPEPPKAERILPAVSSSTKPHLLEMASGETIKVKGFWIEEGQLKFRRFGGMVGIALSEVLKLVPEGPEPSGERIPARLVRLLGPTLLEVRVKGEARRVRLLGIQALAGLDRAREPWRGLQRGDVLQLEFDREREAGEVWLAYIFLASGRMLNAELVRLGLARPAVDPRALKYVDLFHELGGRPTQQ